VDIEREQWNEEGKAAQHETEAREIFARNGCNENGKQNKAGGLP
jgi:hypothetical protein